MKKVTTSVLIWEAQQELLARAASRMGYNVSEYFREVLVPLAAKEAGLPNPSVPAAQHRPISQTALKVDDIVRAVVSELRKQG